MLRLERVLAALVAQPGRRVVKTQLPLDGLRASRTSHRRSRVPMSPRAAHATPKMLDGKSGLHRQRPHAQ